MKIGGFTRFSLIDYPGHMCAIIFTQGCNLRCFYCQNPELVLPEKFAQPIAQEEIFTFLEKRKGLIDAVEFSGGEPLLQDGLIDTIEKIKIMGYLIKIDTNGTIPDILNEILKTRLADYIAMDIKSSLKNYENIAKVKVDINAITESINIIMENAPDYEFRTTVVKGFHNKDEIEKIGSLVRGAKRFFIQRVLFIKTLEDGFKAEDFTEEELQEFKKTMMKYVKYCTIR